MPSDSDDSMMEDLARPNSRNKGLCGGKLGPFGNNNGDDSDDDDDNLSGGNRNGTNRTHLLLGSIQLSEFVDLTIPVPITAEVVSAPSVALILHADRPAAASNACEASPLQAYQYCSSFDQRLGISPATSLVVGQPHSEVDYCAP